MGSHQGIKRASHIGAETQKETLCCRKGRHFSRRKSSLADS